jgi:UDP-N-acetylglucosamine--dolichyl-phosphate N-acetylglucosaminephosphotransferase
VNKGCSLFPKVPDYHKPNKPLVPNGLGVIYVLASAAYLFFLHYFKIVQVNDSGNNVSPALTLAVCILFGGFMGLFDDWMNLRWRNKAFLPLLAALPLAALREGEPIMATYFWGKINFQKITILGMPGETIFYFAVIPLIVTITTNTVNQLGGLNGLETICPTIILFGLLLGSVLGPDPQVHVLLYVPLIIYIILAYFNFRGKIFVGNTGSFAIGITIASYALIANIEQTLAISILPFIINSSLILLNYLFFRTKANVSFDGEKLFSDHRRSLITFITYHRPMNERQVVTIISLLTAISTSAALLVQLLTP